MKMPEVNSIKEALPFLGKALNSALGKEVFALVKKTELEVIKEVVYGAYKPKAYKRRKGGNRGLLDPRSIRAAKGDSDYSLVVVNVAEPNVSRDSYLNAVSWMKVVENADRKNLAKLVEYGHENSLGNKYDFPRKGLGYMKPRPFTYESVERLKRGGNIEDALKNGLQRNGCKVET